MNQFTAWDTAIIASMVVVYILVTTWISIRLRSKTTEQFMVAGRSTPTIVVAILLMSEFIGAKSTIGTSQAAFKVGLAASWSVIAASIGFLFFGLFMAKRLYRSGEFTISGFIAQKYGNTAKLVVSAIMIYALFIVNVGNYVSGAAATASLIVKDFYVPRHRPTPERELKVTRTISFAVGFVPLIFVLFVPQILALSFFTRALRLSVTVVALIGIYLPFFSSNRGAIAGMVLATISTTVWYLLGNPFGIDNMYIALLTPALVMVVDRLVPSSSERQTALR